MPSVKAGPIVNPANGHSYYLLNSSTWTAAEAEAISLGGHLATVNDTAENDWVYNTFIPLTGTVSPSFRPALWIGLSDQDIEGMFVWASGEPITYTNWAGGEPNNSLDREDYVHLIDPLGGSDRMGKWNDEANVAAFPPGPGIPPVVFHGVVEVANLVPSLAISGPDTVTATESNAFTFTTTDDSTGTFSYAIDWGDGITQTLAAGTALTQPHAYAAPGNYTISATVTDPGGLQSTAATHAVAVQSAVEVHLLVPDHQVMGEEYDVRLQVTNNTTAALTTTIEWQERYISAVLWKQPAFSQPSATVITLAPAETRILTLATLKRRWEWLPHDPPTLPSEAQDNVLTQVAQSLPDLLAHLLDLPKFNKKGIADTIIGTLGNAITQLNIANLAIDVHETARIDYLVKVSYGQGMMIADTKAVTLEVSSEQQNHLRAHVLFAVLADRFQTGIPLLDPLLRDVFLLLAKHEYQQALH